jgi:hypothetical protein
MLATGHSHWNAHGQCPLCIAPVSLAGLVPLIKVNNSLTFRGSFHDLTSQVFAFALVHFFIALAVATSSGKAKAQECDPNHAGAGVPIYSDVNCAGGSGNGPFYVKGPVYVVGTGVYRLDRDADGIACEQ